MRKGKGKEKTRMKTVEFVTYLEEVPVALRDKEGVLKQYTLRELTGAQRVDYETSNIPNMEFDKDGKARMISFQGMESGLLSRCLYDENGKLVSQITIESWPSKTQAGLYKIAEKLNGLGKNSEQEAKNDCKGNAETGTE